MPWNSLGLSNSSSPDYEKNRWNKVEMISYMYNCTWSNIKIRKKKLREIRFFFELGSILSNLTNKKGSCTKIISFGIKLAKLSRKIIFFTNSNKTCWANFFNVMGKFADMQPMRECWFGVPSSNFRGPSLTNLSGQWHLSLPYFYLWWMRSISIDDHSKVKDRYEDSQTETLVSSKCYDQFTVLEFRLKS